VKIAASRELCKGHGQCELFAPDVFEVDDDALVTLKVTEIGPDQEKAVEEAISHCPESALKLVTD
jgi:ferredoxin